MSVSVSVSVTVAVAVAAAVEEFILGHPENESDASDDRDKKGLKILVWVKPQNRYTHLSVWRLRVKLARALAAALLITVAILTE